MISILVTGANGQLGRCIQDVAKVMSDTQWYFKAANALDITSKNSISEFFSNNKIDYLVNCAAYTAVDKAETEKEQAFLVNAEAVKYLAEACKENNTKLIHISTDFVFDGNNIKPYLVEDTPNPINVYGASKLKGEQYIQNILSSYFIIRTSWVYSEYGNNFVKTMLRLANERDEIGVISDQKGSPTYAGDLAMFIIGIIQENNTEYGIYHYSNIGGISWYEFAREIFNIFNSKVILKPISSSQYTLPAARPVFSVLDNSKRVSMTSQPFIYWKNSLKKLSLNYNFFT